MQLNTPNKSGQKQAAPLQLTAVKNPQPKATTKGNAVDITWKVYFNRKHSSKYHKVYDSLVRNGTPRVDARIAGAKKAKPFVDELRERWGQKGEHWSYEAALAEPGWMGLGTSTEKYDGLVYEPVE